MAESGDASDASASKVSHTAEWTRNHASNAIVDDLAALLASASLFDAGEKDSASDAATTREPRWSALFTPTKHEEVDAAVSWEAVIKKLSDDILLEAPKVYARNREAGQARVNQELEYQKKAHGWQKTNSYELRENFLQDTMESVLRRRGSVVFTMQEATPYEAALRPNDPRRSQEHSASAVAATEAAAALVQRALGGDAAPAPLAAEKQPWTSLLRDQYSDVFLRRPSADRGVHIAPIVYLELKRLKSVEKESYDSILWGQVVPTMLKLSVQYRVTADDDIISYIVIGDMDGVGGFAGLHFSLPYTLGWLRRKLHTEGFELPSTAEKLAALSPFVSKMKAESPCGKGTMRREIATKLARTPTAAAQPPTCTVAVTPSASNYSDRPPARALSPGTQRCIDFTPPAVDSAAGNGSSVSSNAVAASAAISPRTHRTEDAPCNPGSLALVFGGHPAVVSAAGNGSCTEDAPCNPGSLALVFGSMCSFK